MGRGPCGKFRAAGLADSAPQRQHPVASGFEYVIQQNQYISSSDKVSAAILVFCLAPAAAAAPFLINLEPSPRDFALDRIDSASVLTRRFLHDARGARRGGSPHDHRD